MRRVFVCEYVSGGGAMGSAAEAAELLPAGVAMRDAIVADLQAIAGVQVTCAVSARAGAPAHTWSLAAARPAERFAEFVRRVAEVHDDTWVVAPETDGVLAELHAAVGAPRWIGCAADAIRVASHKRATLEALAAHGIATPLAFAAEARRWVVKPDDGAGAAATRVHDRLDAARADLQIRLLAGCRATLEPWVEGEPLSISLLAGARSAEAVAFNRQDIDVGADGTLAWHGVRHHAIDPLHDPRAAALHALATAVHRALPGLRGYVGIDLVWHARRGPVAIEVNPRVTCAYVGLSTTLRRNLAADVLALHALPEDRRATA